MTELTLEALEKRVEALEKKVAEQNSPQAKRLAWLASLPVSADSELVRQVHNEIAAAREAEREAAREGNADKPQIVE